MSKLPLWCDNVSAEFYDEQLNNDPEYVVGKLHEDIIALRDYTEKLQTKYMLLQAKVILDGRS